MELEQTFFRYYLVISLIICSIAIYEILKLLLVTKIRIYINGIKDYIKLNSVDQNRFILIYDDNIDIKYYKNIIFNDIDIKKHMLNKNIFRLLEIYNDLIFIKSGI